jgi:DNA polymerase-3 subunit gamma/tau
LTADTLIASLVEHLRNLLILRACGKDSELVEVPGLSMPDLLSQSGRFEMAALSQDIALLEELRRNLKSSQAGRALLDAALVRLALAGQFLSVEGLLEQIDGRSAPGEALKKNAEPRVISSPPPAIGPAVEPAGNVPEQATISTDDDGDDDLPRPGKVWTGPSLAELARQPMKTPSSSPITPPASNVEAVDPSDLPAIWQAMLALLATKGPALAPLVEGGRFIGVQDGRAIIRYPQGHETMLKMLDRNGKKEQIRDAFTQVLGESVGIAFECDSESAAQTAPAAAPAPPAAPPAPRTNAPSASPQKQQMTPAEPQIRLTAELCASIRESDPLVRAAMEELGGEIVRVE